MSEWLRRSRRPRSAASARSPRATRPARRGPPDPRADGRRRQREGAPARTGRMRPGSPAYSTYGLAGKRAAGQVPGLEESVPVQKYRRIAGRAAEAWIERIAERIAEEVEGEDRGENGDAGADAHPPLEIGQIPLGVVHVLAPGRIRRLRTEAEEGERGFGQDREGRGQRRLHDERIDHVREDVAGGGAGWRGAGRAGGRGEIARGGRGGPGPRGASERR